MKKLFLGAIFLIFCSGCGTNTDTPTYPFILLIPPNIPQIVGIIPTDSATARSYSAAEDAGTLSPKPEFFLKYYVTNTEQNFVGYNLFIFSTTPSLAETQAGGAPYLRNGVEPSFPHLATESSTERINLKYQRISDRIPPPGVTPFQKCEVYTFTLRAVFRNTIPSNPSAAVRACASKNPSACVVGSSCNSSDCSVASCSSQSTCIVGTLCNPCKISGKELDGCECPAGTSPPGCNP
ncbi:MAG: hypothetical protein K8R21_12510 [Leptospira sp.]|nr:hypothetical protein [Leptospira sp.]